MRNTEMLSDNFIAAIRSFYAGKSMKHYLGEEADYRCNLFARHLIWWELTAVFYPQKMQLDIFDLLC